MAGLATTPFPSAAVARAQTSSTEVRASIRCSCTEATLTVAVTLAITADANGTINDFSLPDGTTVSGVELLNVTTGSGDDHVTFANTTTPGTQYWYGRGGNDTAVIDFSAFGSTISASGSSSSYHAGVDGESQRRLYPLRR
jgi:hypothetical protein